MNRWSLVSAIIVIVVLSAGCAFAQPDPAHPQPDIPPGMQKLQQLVTQMVTQRMAEQRTQVLYTPQGIFIERNGTLALLNAATLKEQKVIELFGALPEMPAGADVAPKARQQWLLQLAKRLLPTAMLASGNDLLILVGDQFFRVDIPTQEIKASVSLVPEKELVRNNGRLMFAMLAMPTLELHDKTLYITRGDQLFAVNIDDGTVLASGTMPVQMQMQAKLPGLDQLLHPDKAPANPKRTGKNTLNDTAITIVGVMVKHADANGDFWTVKNNLDEEYVLKGEALPQLLATPKIEGARARLTGQLTHEDNIPQFSAGSLVVEQYQVLP